MSVRPYSLGQTNTQAGKEFGWQKFLYVPNSFLSAILGGVQIMATILIES